MPILQTDSPVFPPPQVPPRKRWTRDECAPLEASGIFERERLELVAGELISKMGKNRPHVNAFMLMQYWLMDTFGRHFVNAEAPIDVAPADNPINEPVPDLIVLNKEGDAIVSGNPQPQDVRLVVEISDSTLNFDRTVKARLYARAGIAEYWVLDVSGRRLFCHRDPVSGSYESVIIYEEHEVVNPLAAPEVDFCAARVLGKE